MPKYYACEIIVKYRNKYVPIGGTIIDGTYHSIYFKRRNVVDVFTENIYINFYFDLNKLFKKYVNY